jgi:hypothetical protein
VVKRKKVKYLFDKGKKKKYVGNWFIPFTTHGSFVFTHYFVWKRKRKKTHDESIGYVSSVFGVGWKV